MSNNRGLIVVLAGVAIATAFVGYVLARNRREPCQGHHYDGEDGAGLDREYIEQYERIDN